MAAVANAQAGQPAGRNGIQALLGLVQNIALVTVPCAEALLNIVILSGQHFVNHKRSRSCRRDAPEPAHTATQNHTARNQQDQHDSRVMGFFVQQNQHRQQRQHGQHNAVKQCSPLFIIPVRKAGKPQNSRKLCQLRRLQGCAKHIHPAVTAVVRLTEQGPHQKQQR